MLNEAFSVKSRLSMAFQPSAHPKQANDALASKSGIFSENHCYKSFHWQLLLLAG